MSMGFQALRGSYLAMTLSLALAVTPGAVAADDTRDARIAAAQTYLAATLEDLDLSEVIGSMYRPLLEQIRASGKLVTAEQEARIDALYLDTMSEPMLALMRAQDQIMADLLTLEEIEALHAFNQTPIGRSVLQKLPKIVEAQMPMTMAVLQERMSVMMPTLMEILD